MRLLCPWDFKLPPRPSEGVTKLPWTLYFRALYKVSVHLGHQNYLALSFLLKTLRKRGGGSWGPSVVSTLTLSPFAVVLPGGPWGPGAPILP